MDELMQDHTTIRRLEMLGGLFRAHKRINCRRDQAHLVNACLMKWHPKANMFLCFQAYISKIKYVQDWWRRMSANLREVRERIAKRWEKIERQGTSGYQEAMAPPSCVYFDPIDPARRNAFLEHELRARRFFLLSNIRLWEEDSAKWRVEYEARKRQGLKPSFDVDQLPRRPSHLPPGHPPGEGPKAPCAETCLGRQGDAEILAMIQAARNNPKGGGWKQVPQKNAKSKDGQKKKSGGSGEEQSDSPTGANFFGE